MLLRMPDVECFIVCSNGTAPRVHHDFRRPHEHVTAFRTTSRDSVLKHANIDTCTRALAQNSVYMSKSRFLRQ